MSTEKHKRITSSWAINGTVPNPDQRYPHYGQNISVGVQADTVELAMSCVREMYPSITFMAIHHRGDIHFIAPTP